MAAESQGGTTYIPLTPDQSCQSKEGDLPDGRRSRNCLGLHFALA
jgi:hypothetical protein